MRVLVPFANGLEELEAVTIIDVLRRGGLEVTSVALGTELQIHGSRGITLLADATWDSLDPTDFDAIVLPGGGKGTETLCADERVIQAVQTFAQESKIVAALCAAPTVLALAGVLDDRKATCYPSCAPQLGRAYDDAPVIADGHIITSQGPGTAMLFSLVLIQHLVGEETAHQVAKSLITSF